MSSLSIAIISLNEEQNLARLLPLLSSLKAEIVIVDALSTDGTLAVCEKNNVRVFSEQWSGYVAAKQSAINKCQGDWILQLDCDELPDELLLQSLKEVLNKDEIGAYTLARKTVYLNRVLDYAWQPDVHLRLVHRSLQPKVVNVNGHDMLQCDTEKTSQLRGWLMHYSYRSIEHHFQKTLMYARLGALEYFQQGRKFSILHLLLNPIVAFMKLYILRAGFRDGLAGFIAGVSTWLHVFLKYLFLWELNNKSR